MRIRILYICVCECVCLRLGVVLVRCALCVCEKLRWCTIRVGMRILFDRCNILMCSAALFTMPVSFHFFPRFPMNFPIWLQHLACSRIQKCQQFACRIKIKYSTKFKAPMTNDAETRCSRHPIKGGKRNEWKRCSRLIYLLLMIPISSIELSSSLFCSIMSIEQIMLCLRENFVRPIWFEMKKKKGKKKRMIFSTKEKVRSKKKTARRTFGILSGEQKSHCKTFNYTSMRHVFWGLSSYSLFAFKIVFIPSFWPCTACTDSISQA